MEDPKNSDEKMPEDSGEEIEQKSTENEEKIEPQNTNPEPEEPVPEKGISPIMIEDEMKNSYIDYAMSVIVGRALPDVRDGLKPVHRRILYAMHDMSMHYNKPFKKVFCDFYVNNVCSHVFRCLN